MSLNVHDFLLVRDRKIELISEQPLKLFKIIPSLHKVPGIKVPTGKKYVGSIPRQPR